MAAHDAARLLDNATMPASAPAQSKPAANLSLARSI